MTKQKTRHPKTISVPEAGEIYFGIGRSASYAAAHCGEIPTIKVGRMYRVPVSAMDKLLEDAGIRNVE